MKPDHKVSTHKLHTSRLSFPRRSLTRAILALLAISVIAIAITGHWSKARVSAAGTANIIFALTNNNQLLRFNAGTPGTLIGAAVGVTGLVAGDTLVGIDFRPATGQLYGLGVNGAVAHLYIIATTGVATQIGGNIALPESAGVVAGTDYGFDFNPTVDRIRVVANSRDNFRLNPDNGAVAGVDTALTAGAVVVGAAYDRNAAGLVQTTLFGIDSNTDQLVTIGGVNGVPSPNTGAVTAIGNLGVNTNNEVGFDIAGDTAGSAYASLQVGGVSGFYTVNLGTGAATLVGAIAGATPIRDIAVAPGGVLRFTAPTYTISETANLANIVVTRTGGAFGAASVTVTTSNGTATAGLDYTARTVTLNFADGVTTQNFDIPILDDALIEGNETVILTFSNYTGCGLTGGPGLLTITDNEDGVCNLWAVDANNNLIRFTADVPGQNITSVPITGLAPGERIAGIDFRPATGQLYALAVSPVGGRLYTLNLSTAAATVIGGPGFTLPQSAGVAAGGDYGLDFNPTVDRIRVVADSRDNFRVNPDTGGVAGVDTALTAGSVIAGAAYDRNFIGSPQPATTLYAIDANTDQLVTIGGIDGTPSPNTGAVTPIGPLGVNTSTVIGFDIINGAEGTAFAVLSPVGGQQGLYTINLTTGAATPVGLINNPVPIVAFAAATAGTVQLSTSLYTISEAAGTATITVTRTGGACGSIQVTATTSNGTATTAPVGADPADYVATTVTLNFPEGVTSRTFTIPIINDNVDEPDQTVNITLSANVGGRITPPSSAVLTIADDDLSAISINDIKVAEGYSGQSNAVFTVSLSNANTQTVTVNYATANGTATAGTDYVATAGVVTFNPGVTTQTISIPIIGDAIFEPDETFFVNLSNAVNGGILDGQGEGTIINDDSRFDVPGAQLPPENSAVNDQKPGSLLIFPVYTSLITGSNNQNTRINITNADAARNVQVHIFLVDGTSCSASDAFICLTANQTTTFLASDLDPGTTGYLVAVAVDSSGCPIIFNSLIGDEYVKFASGHAANLGAEAVAGLAGLANVVCSVDTPTVQLNFDNLMYNWLPRTLAADSLPDRASGNDTLLIIDRIGGSLINGAATLGGIFGLLFDDTETGVSFSFTPATCQFRSSLSNAVPRTTPRYEQVIPSGHTGWMKLYSFNDAAILGVTINFNPNADSSSNAFNQGHNLHKLTLTTAGNFIMPVFPAAC